MAGGEGSRLRPLTSHTPKPMLPLANRPMMEHIVGLLREHGYTEIVVTVAFLANQIRNYFGDGSDEANLVYQFALPPLVLHAFVSGSAARLRDWAGQVGPVSPTATWFNFLASHDGIGLRASEGILDDAEYAQAKAKALG